MRFRGLWFRGVLFRGGSIEEVRRGVVEDAAALLSPASIIVGSARIWRLGKANLKLS